MRLVLSLVVLGALVIASQARAGQAPPPDFGTPEWRDVERSFGDFCRRDPSKACRQLMKAFRLRPASIEMQVDSDRLIVEWGSRLRTDYFELGECDWDGSRWAHCHIEAGGFH